MWSEKEQTTVSKCDASWPDLRAKGDVSWPKSRLGPIKGALLEVTVTTDGPVVKHACVGSSFSHKPVPGPDMGLI